MTDLPTLAAVLLSNFATVRLARWEPQCTLRPTALAGQGLILRCNHQYLRHCLLDHGYRAFFDHLESDEPDGWRPHFFCLKPSAVDVLYGAGVDECGPGDPVRLDPQDFVVRRLNSLSRSGYIDKPKDWWWFFDWFAYQNEKPWYSFHMPIRAAIYARSSPDCPLTADQSVPCGRPRLSRARTDKAARAH